MKNYSFAVDDPDVKAVIDVLQYVAADPELRKELEKEWYYQEAMEGMFGDIGRKLAEAIQQKEDAVQQKEEAMRYVEATK